MNGPTTSYIERLDTALLDKAKASTKKRYPLSPSAAGKCSRALAHDLAAYHGMEEKLEEVRPGRVERLLSLGNYVEGQIVDELKLLKDFDIRFTQQTVDLFTLPSGRVVEGSTDVALWSEKYKCVMDVKTIGDRFHSQFGTKWRGLIMDYSRMASVEVFGTNAFYIKDLTAFLEEVNPEDSIVSNLLQLNGYCCSPFFAGRNVDHGVILRYLKNTSELMEVRFAPSLVEFRKLQEKFARIENAVLVDKDPTKVAKDYILGSMFCAYCPQKNKCHPAAGKRDFYKNTPKQWPTRTKDLEKGAELEGMLREREAIELTKEALAKLDTEILLMMDGHDVEKIELNNGDVYVSVKLSKSTELRRSKK